MKKVSYFLLIYTFSTNLFSTLIHQQILNDKIYFFPNYTQIDKTSNYFQIVIYLINACFCLLYGFVIDCLTINLLVKILCFLYLIAINFEITGIFSQEIEYNFVGDIFNGIAKETIIICLVVYLLIYSQNQLGKGFFFVFGYGFYASSAITTIFESCNLFKYQIFKNKSFILLEYLFLFIGVVSFYYITIIDKNRKQIQITRHGFLENLKKQLKNSPIMIKLFHCSLLYGVSLYSPTLLTTKMQQTNASNSKIETYINNALNLYQIAFLVSAFIGTYIISKIENNSLQKKKCLTIATVICILNIFLQLYFVFFLKNSTIQIIFCGFLGLFSGFQAGVSPYLGVFYIVDKFDGEFIGTGLSIYTLLRSIIQGLIILNQLTQIYQQPGEISMFYLIFTIICLILILICLYNHQNEKINSEPQYKYSRTENENDQSLLYSHEEENIQNQFDQQPNIQQINYYEIIN